MPDNLFLYLLADAKLRIQLYMPVYNCIFKLMFAKSFSSKNSCIYLSLHAKIHMQLFMRLYSFVCMYMSVHS